MKRYEGIAYLGGHRMIELLEGGQRRPLVHIGRHAPTRRMDWGPGSSPAHLDTALSILTDLLGADDAERHYRAYEQEVIRFLQQGHWLICETQIREWLDTRNESAA